MAERRERRSAGLSFGQLITLTFGFLLASLFIFVFGFWVGHDLADQRALHRRQPLRVPLEAAPTAVAVAAAPQAPAPPPVVPPTAPPTHAAPPFTATPVPPPATNTAVMVVTTPTRRPVQTPTAAGNWTVLAYSTNDTVRAVMLARTLRAKGYDATTGERKVGTVTWFTVKVGHFRDRAAAKAMESKLRDAEGLEAATVMSQ
jgi:cell division septation protein DedD